MTTEVDTSASGDDRPTGLRDDIGTADRILGPTYRQADELAIRFQSRFRIAELAIIYGGVIAVILGTLAAYKHHPHVRVQHPKEAERSRPHDRNFSVSSLSCWPSPLEPYSRTRSLAREGKRRSTVSPCPTMSVSRPSV